MGKSGIIGRKIAATLSSTGTPAYFLHPGEGMHGDLGMLMKDDVILAISNSGETPELLQVLPVVKHFNLAMIAITGNPNSTLGRKSDVVLDISVEKEACPLNLAPTTSTTNTLVLGDALAIVLMERKGFTSNDFAVFHPAGSLGKRLLLTVEEVMHTGAEIPIVPRNQTFRHALMEITSKKLGLTLVVDETGRTVGIITDGDVRRVLNHHDNIAQLTVEEVFNRTPKSISRDALAATALNIMETHKITALMVNDDQGFPVGIVHLHDLLNTGLK
jgi:arabinose-5-phosphate isomerase